MKRMKIKKRAPLYSKGEEIFNMTSHIVGAGFGLVAMIIMVIKCAARHDGIGVISSIVFGLSMILLYTISSIYHGLKRGKGKRVLRIIDHCTIFILIAGTYTPYITNMFMKYDKQLGIRLMIFMWGAAILGVILNAINLEKYKSLSVVCYLIMGWCGIIKLPLLVNLLGKIGFTLLVLGGISYTIGAIIYVIGKKKQMKYSHSIFHLFIVFGTIFQTFSIIFYVI